MSSIRLYKVEYSRSSLLEACASAVPSGIRHAIEYVELHFAEPISVAELAEKAQLNRTHFLYSFKLATGNAPHQYLLRARLGQARRLLSDREQPLPLTDIAAASGFSDQAYMSRLFQRFFGTTPAAFRRLQGQL